LCRPAAGRLFQDPGGQQGHRRRGRDRSEADPAYESLDKDKDGIVTLAEVDAVAPDWAERLHACDTDRDKTLTRGEYDVQADQRRALIHH
jgi:hypothetical protein